ncbi:MAG: SfiI family type II restriction endonuclease [Thermomicrobiales bacterium]
MSIVEDIATLSLDHIESAEMLTQRWIFQAMLDFGMEAYRIFLSSPDDVKDVAEDITREALDRLPGFNVSQRIYGTVDYKKAKYIVFPDSIVRQALFVDSKAEKSSNSATIQMSQTSLRVMQVRSGSEMNELGLLPSISRYEDRQYLTTTIFIHFEYADQGNLHVLKNLTIACLPNGLLQERYSPNAQDNIWLAGRNAPTLGEVFRARFSFGKLRSKEPWRVQTVLYDPLANMCSGIWSS